MGSTYFATDCQPPALQKKGLYRRCFPAILHLYLDQLFVARLRVTAYLFLETYVNYHSPSRSLQPDDGDMADPSLTPLHD